MCLKNMVMEYQWFEELPPSCPPFDSVECDGTYFRVSHGNPAESERVATAYLKLLFPHVTSADMLNLDEFNMYCFQSAIRRRDIVREQCSNIDAESSFSKPMPEYSILSR